VKSKMKNNRATTYRQTASAKIHHARDEKTLMPRAARLGTRRFEGFAVFSYLRANSISPAKFRIHHLARKLTFTKAKNLASSTGAQLLYM